ncbi:tubulin polyglutamylase complex subunit 1 [Spea bombifrons]|uniref:tubulin polyglutamylase complex subunit 1 n=1 Tax=Spea bombifrons TaxID=233779 RepID=UPI00234ABDD7|nr:tubulin polyglutamylase complex subunit 1 [Spea bombifrons]
MATEKRRAAGGSPVPRPTPSPASEADFLAQTGVRDMLREAVLKLLEARPEEPVAFLADYFEKMGQVSGDGRAVPGDQGSHLPGQQRFGRAMWYLRLAHHSQRTAFNNNLNIAYECLSAGGKKRMPGLNGKSYGELLRRICREGDLPEEISSALLKKIQCRDHEAVPFDVFRYGVLTCFVMLEFMCKADTLFTILDGPSQADQRLCHAVLTTLEEALVASDLCVPASYLEAGSKLGPDCLAVVMDGAFRNNDPSVHLSRREFLKEASVLFLDKVKPVQ